MDGRKAVPLRALIVEERVKSFKTRWYRVKETFTPLYVQHTRAFHFRKRKWRTHFCGMIEGEKDNELSKPKGTNDILPGTSEKWQFVEETARLIFKDYQYQEIRTPIFEHYEVISRSVGDTTDIVSKEMYDFMIKETVT